MIGDDSDAVTLLRASLAEDPRQITTIAALAPALIGAGRYAEAKHLADSIVVAENAPPIMVQMSRARRQRDEGERAAGQHSNRRSNVLSEASVVPSTVRRFVRAACSALAAVS